MTRTNNKDAEGGIFQYFLLNYIYLGHLVAMRIQSTKWILASLSRIFSIPLFNSHKPSARDTS